MEWALRTSLRGHAVTSPAGIRVGRVMRRWYRAKGLTKRVRRERVDERTGRVRTRVTTVRKTLFAANRGFVTVNDGPSMASQLARYLAGLKAACTRRGVDEGELQWTSLRLPLGDVGREDVQQFDHRVH